MFAAYIRSFHFCVSRYRNAKKTPNQNSKVSLVLQPSTSCDWIIAVWGRGLENSRLDIPNKDKMSFKFNAFQPPENEQETDLLSCKL